MSRVGMYNHLKVNSPLDLQTIADTLVNANYGVHQMCSALVAAWHRQNPNGSRFPSQTARASPTSVLRGDCPAQS